jgi:hypothetical protein
MRSGASARRPDRVAYRSNTLRRTALIAFALAGCGDTDEPGLTGFATIATTTDGDPPIDQTSTSGAESTSAAADDTADETSESSESSSSSTSDSTTGEPERVCPEDGPPPGPAVNKFDVVTLSCGGPDQLDCPADDDQCFCQPHFDALNVGPPHFISTGTDGNKENVWAAGNFQSAYVNDLNTNWPAGGQARADEVITTIQEAFPCGEPTWYIVNEISASQWPDNAEYRQFVIDFATAMDIDYDKHVVIAAPFANPGNNAADWSALADHAYIGAEVYLSGAAVNASGNSVAWCLAQYQDAVDAYAALGVPLSRLFLVEHFGQTTPDKTWGRAGVSVGGWHNAIEARSTASHMIDFPGYVSYAWSWNTMHETDENRFDFMATYVALPLP